MFGRKGQNSSINDKGLTVPLMSSTDSSSFMDSSDDDLTTMHMNGNHYNDDDVKAVSSTATTTYTTASSDTSYVSMSNYSVEIEEEQKNDIFDNETRLSGYADYSNMNGHSATPESVMSQILTGKNNPFSIAAKTSVEDKVKKHLAELTTNIRFKKLKAIKEFIGTSEEKITNLKETEANWLDKLKLAQLEKTEIEMLMRNFRNDHADYATSEYYQSLATNYIRLVGQEISADLESETIAHHEDGEIETQTKNLRLLTHYRKTCEKKLALLKKAEKEAAYLFTSQYSTTYKLYYANYLAMLVSDLTFSLWTINQSGETLDDLMDLVNHPHLSSDVSAGTTIPFALADAIYNVTLFTPGDETAADIYNMHALNGYSNYPYLNSVQKYWQRVFATMQQQTFLQNMTMIASESFHFQVKKIHNFTGAAANVYGLEMMKIAGVQIFQNMGWEKWLIYAPLILLGNQYYSTGYDPAFDNGRKQAPNQFKTLFQQHLIEDGEYARTFATLIQGFAATALRAASFVSIGRQILTIEPSPLNSWVHQPSYYTLIFVDVFLQALGHRFPKTYNAIFGSKDKLTAYFLELIKEKDKIFPYAPHFLDETDMNRPVNSRQIYVLRQTVKLSADDEHIAVKKMLKEIATITQKAYTKYKTAELYSIMTWKEYNWMLTGNFLASTLSGATVGVLAFWYSPSLINFLANVVDAPLDALGTEIVQTILGTVIGSLGFVAANRAPMQTAMDAKILRSLTPFKHEDAFKNYLKDFKDETRLKVIEGVDLDATHTWAEFFYNKFSVDLAITLANFILINALISRTEAGIAPTAKPEMGYIDLEPLLLIVLFLISQQNINGYYTFIDQVIKSFISHGKDIWSFGEATFNYVQKLRYGKTAAETPVENEPNTLTIELIDDEDDEKEQDITPTVTDLQEQYHAENANKISADELVEEYRASGLEQQDEEEEEEIEKQQPTCFTRSYNRFMFFLGYETNKATVTQQVQTYQARASRP